MTFRRLRPVGAVIAEHGELFASFLAHIGHPSDADDVARAAERFQLAYQCTFNSVVDWAEQQLEDTSTLGIGLKSCAAL
jgi:hypothetical protein